MARTPAFAYDLSDGSRTTLGHVPSLAEKTLRRLVSLMDENRSTVCLWKMPDGADLFELDRAEWPSVFLQAAGTADAMTIEWRRLDADGVERLYTVGHGGGRSSKPSVAINFLRGKDLTFVYPDELFIADEAGEIFVHYLYTHTVHDRYVLREVDLAPPIS